MKAHYLKTWPVFFKAVESGRKTFEVRLDDREFEVDDLLVLQEWDPEVAARDSNPSSGYTGIELRRRVTYVLLAGEECPALKDGYCVMGLGPDILAHPSILTREPWVARGSG
jgi:Domain of unknown function (DUF3850)